VPFYTKAPIQNPYGAKGSLGYPGQRFIKVDAVQGGPAKRLIGDPPGHSFTNEEHHKIQCCFLSQCPIYFSTHNAAGTATAVILILMICLVPATVPSILFRGVWTGDSYCFLSKFLHPQGYKTTDYSFLNDYSNAEIGIGVYRFY
jgi:hypothetical protein